MITSGALPEVEEQFQTYGIDLAGKLNFNGTLAGALKDPLVTGHAELGSLIVNGRDLGSLNANIATTATETRVNNGRLIQPNGGGAQFALVIPRVGESNTSIDATLDRMNTANLLAALPMAGGTRDQFGNTEGEASGSVKITGIPEQDERRRRPAFRQRTSGRRAASEPDRARDVRRFDREHREH